jgi:predicted metal-dependent hydrolase
MKLDGYMVYSNHEIDWEGVTVMKLSYGTGTRGFEFTVEYRARKTMSIEVRQPGTVRVIAPRGVSRDRIMNAVELKSDWIIDKLGDAIIAGERNRKREYVNGERFVILGKELALRIVENESLKAPRATLLDGHIRVEAGSRNDDAISRAIESMYRQKAFEVISDSIERYKHRFDIKPSIVRIKAQKKRWGSCSSKRALNFNWKCVMSPLPIIDYIVVHEMCHLVHMNHSSDFWNLVGGIMPDWKERREWLRKNGVMHDV